MTIKVPESKDEFILKDGSLNKPLTLNISFLKQAGRRLGSRNYSASVKHLAWQAEHKIEIVVFF